jgi:hypothetical protein
MGQGRDRHVRPCAMARASPVSMPEVDSCQAKITTQAKITSSLQVAGDARSLEGFGHKRTRHQTRGGINDRYHMVASVKGSALRHE